jgi:hypothetical protein
LIKFFNNLWNVMIVYNIWLVQKDEFSPKKYVSPKKLNICYFLIYQHIHMSWIIHFEFIETIIQMLHIALISIETHITTYASHIYFNRLKNFFASLELSTIFAHELIHSLWMCEIHYSQITFCIHHNFSKWMYKN